MLAITSFSGEYRWLSNFYPVEIEFEGLIYPSIEHAYQAAKTDIQELREAIKNLQKPGDAKKAGKFLLQRECFKDNNFKVSLMAELCLKKFQNDKLAAKLIATKEARLIEGNYWHDNFWGVCECKKCGNSGLNHLGNIISMIRAKLIIE